MNPSQSEIGWIRLYRKITEWRWYGVPNMMAVFIHLLISANHKDGYCYGFEVKRGQLLTSQAKIMERIDIKRGALRECLDKLVASGEIVIVTTNKHSLITICNYDSYQGGEDNYNQQTANKPPTENRQTVPQDIPQSDPPTATNNNNKNKKNERMKETLYLKKTYKKVRFAFFSAIRLHALTAGRKSNHPSSNSLLVIRGDIQQCPCLSVRRAKFRVLSLKWYN